MITFASCWETKVTQYGGWHSFSFSSRSVQLSENFTKGYFLNPLKKPETKKQILIQRLISNLKNAFAGTIRIPLLSFGQKNRSTVKTTSQVFVGILLHSATICYFRAFICITLQIFPCSWSKWFQTESKYFLNFTIIIYD